MFKYILMLVPVVSFAQVPAGTMQRVDMPAVCGATSTVLEVIRKHDEQHVWDGKEGNVIVSVWANDQTKSFTVMKTSSTGEFSCVIAMGQGTPITKD